MYKDALRTLERKFGQPQAVVSAHLDKLSNFPRLKMHNSDNIINYSAAICSLVGVFKSLSFDADLKSASLLNQVVQKLTPNMKESWWLFTVKKHWVKATLLDFNDWLKEKAEAHNLLKQSATKANLKITALQSPRPKQPQKCLHQIRNKVQQRSKCHLLPQTPTLAVLYATVTTGYGSVQFSRKRLQPRELSWWGIINFAFRAYATSTRSASALNQESAEQRGAIVRITRYCMEQIGFSQQNSQQILIPLSLLATHVKVKQPPVNSCLIGPQQCHLLLMLRGSFR